MSFTSYFLTSSIWEGGGAWKSVSFATVSTKTKVVLSVKSAPLVYDCDRGVSFEAVSQEGQVKGADLMVSHLQGRHSVVEDTPAGHPAYHDET